MAIVLRNFNSTMVRLKEEASLRFLLFFEFQFHYGTIKRKICNHEGNPVVISIPLWYD